jgi:hypothetical protein
VRSAAMTNALQTAETPRLDRQRSEIQLRFGRAVDIKASADVSSTGLLAIAVLVSGILLSTAVLVRSAVREGRRFPGGPR